ncbi:MAG: ABC transporter permease [Saccharofermentans sp.]|nr:ABC transporter permease [Saccharofermentans sp.]
MNRKAIRTLAYKAFRNSGGLKTNASGMTFLIMLLLSVSFIMVIGSYTFPWRVYSELFETQNGSILIINQPDSFDDFLYEADIPHTNELHLQTDAYYDFTYFEELLDKHDSYMAVVFPQNFDEAVFDSSSEEAPEILTYIREDNLIFSPRKDYVVDTILSPYQSYIKEHAGKIIPINEPVTVEVQGTATAPETSFSSGIMRFAALSLAPLILFIVMLYASMNSGTNIIAGEKEKGTFAAILLSPVSRLELIMGDLIGVSLAAFLPALVILVFIFLLPSYSGLPGLMVAIPLLLSLAILIASLTILISVISDSVVSAQTAFLPLFFIMVTICVTCIQSVDSAEGIYRLIPVYGHFYGLGSIICECTARDLGCSLVCILLTLIISAICIYVSVRLLSSERFTMNNMSDEDHKTSGKKSKLTGKTLPGFIIDQAVYPLVILSIFQTLAMLPVLIKYSSTSAFADIVESMKAVNTFADLFSFSFELLGSFLADPLFIVSMSVGYLLMMCCYLVKVMLKERIREKKGRIRKHLASLGLCIEKSTLIKYVGGLVLGVALMSSVYLILNLTGQVTFEGFNTGFDVVSTVLISLLMWLPQGACEELMFRGYMLPRITERTNRIFAFILSSFLFSVLHSMNAGYTPLASLNLFLIAILFALISYRSGSIWITCGAHTAWNFCQGNLYGLQVSGNELSSTLIKTSYTKSHLDIVTGGAFGPEGGLAVSAVTLPLVILLIVLIKKDSKKTSRLW